VVLRGECRGTVNFLWPEDVVTPERRALAELLGLVATADWILRVQ
jgi:hypothetical protein